MSMSMSNHFDSLREISRLNNDGARYLASNLAGEAVKALKGALMIMGKIANDDDDMMEDSEDNEINDCPSLDVPGLDGSFFIYNRALFLEVQPSGVDLTATNAVILFNLALAFHQRGLTCGHQAKLSKALHLYDLCTKLIGDISSRLGPLALAALNNQAQIYYSICDYARTEEMLSNIRSVAEYVPMPSPSGKSAFEERHFEEIYLNVAITQTPTTAASA
jgi:hypothetical protein